MSEYSQGVCEDGAAILHNGQMMTIEEILVALRERDAAIKRAQVAEGDRDALAAHVERYCAAYVKLTNTELTKDADTREVMHLVKVALMDEFDAIADDTPTTSLARWDAKAKAAAVASLRSPAALSPMSGGEVQECLDGQVAEIRRQAQEE